MYRGFGLGGPCCLDEGPPSSLELARHASGSAVATKILEARKLAALDDRK
jgi:hypothetical protein